MNSQKQNKNIGTMGETFILERLTNKGFSLYKRNIRQWGMEIDLVVYKYNPMTKFLDIRIVEVKTRLKTSGTYLANLEGYDLEGKWRRVRGRLFDFRNQITQDLGLEVLGSSSHFDLAIVFLKLEGSSGIGVVDNIQNMLRMHTYIKDVNLFI